MAKPKNRPAGIPEENVYNRLHWTHYIALAAAAAAVFLLVAAGA